MSAELAGRLASADLTYGHVGATRGTLPPGYHHLRISRQVGSGPASFASAASALQGWQVHLLAGLHVTASAPVAVPDAVVLLGVGVGPLRIRAACRVIYAVTESRRHGFAYGTLAGHPESGEECFMVEQRDDDSVAFTITAFSRAATVAARAAGPAGRIIQLHITRRYVGALGAIIAS